MAALLVPAAGFAGPAASPSFAFYYSKDIPWEALGAFDVAVVEPGNVEPAGWAHRLNPGTVVAAYVSVGEVHPTRPYFSKIRPEWKLGENTAWGSVVIDQAGTGWVDFYLATVIDPLWNAGYRAFFLDTLDSFLLVAKTPAEQKRQADALAAVVTAIKRQHPDAKLVLNRGFEILPKVHTLAFAVAAESLYQGWDAKLKEYREVPADDREWLLGQLRKCRDDYRLPVIAIDYVDPGKRKLARETAKKIKALGFIPWVATPDLNSMGVGQVEVLPRQVLAIHDEAGNDAMVASHEIHRVGTLPLNYLGLDVQYVYANSETLRRIADQPLAGRYAGIVTWFNQGPFDESAAMVKLINAARSQGVPVVMVGELPGDAVMESFGVDIGASRKITEALAVEKRSPHVDYEIASRPQLGSFTPAAVREGDVWLRVTTPQGDRSDAVAVMPWGGFAADRFWKVDLPQNNGERWVVDPVAFFQAALQRDPAVPVPDVTTESGRRLLMVHVDGDGFPSRAEVAGTPLAGEVMLKEFLQRYRFPSTVSLIEAEIAPYGLYPDLSPRMQATARTIFALPNVEIASHTWSHPFYWADLENGTKRGNAVMALNLPNYRYDPKREIFGSRDYMNSLAPAGKSTRMLLWSGNCQPLARPVEMAYQAGMLNMNGGETLITAAEPTLTLVSPIGIMKGEWFQVYGPNQNENVYTNNWTGPFYGFGRVTETFEMTDLPMRLKPVDIYYHTYIATKRASIASLHKVYGWAEQQLNRQALHPVFASEYAERVLDWRRATVAMTDAGFELRSGQHLRQWRVDAGQEMPVFSAASGMAGHKVHGTVDYLHVSGPIATVAGSTTASQALYLESANAKLVSWSEAAGLQRWVFEGHQALNARFAAPAGCSVSPAGSSDAGSAGLRSARTQTGIEIQGGQGGRTTVVLRCTG